MRQCSLLDQMFIENKLNRHTGLRLLRAQPPAFFCPAICPACSSFEPLAAALYTCTCFWCYGLFILYIYCCL